MILVTGSDGQLGRELKKVLPIDDTLYANKSQLDITNEKKVLHYVKENKVSVIVNCAAYTAVDNAESDRDIAFLVNTLALRSIGKVSRQLGIKIIHISTDYVFDGESNQAYTESCKTNPRSVYGRSKLDGEKELLANASTAIVIRTSWLYSKSGESFISKITKIAKENERITVVDDQIGSPTRALDLAQAIGEILPNLEEGTKEVFHYSNEGEISWYDFAVEIVKLQSINCTIEPVKSSVFKTAAPRPMYSVMDKKKIKNKYNLNILNWKESLSRELRT